MRKVILAVFVLFLAAGCSKKEITEEFSFEPLNPKSGEEITVYFKADSSTLKTSEEITMNAYLYDSEITETIGYEMTNEGSYWKGVFQTNPETKGVVIKFLSGETEETNDGKSFVILLNKDNPEMLLEAEAGYAALLAGWGRAAGVEVDAEAAITEFEKVFAKNSNLKRKFFENYISAIKRLNDLEKLKSEVNYFVDNTIDLTDEENYNLYFIYKNDLEDSVKAADIKNQGLEKFPNGKFKLLDLNSKMNDETNYEAKLVIFDTMIKEFSNEDRVKNLYDNLAVQMAKDGKFDLVWDYFLKYGDKTSPYYRYYAANKILEAEGDISLAEKIAKNGIDFGKSEFNNPTLDKPKTSSAKEWKESRGFELGMNLFIHGKVLHKQGKLKEASQELKEAVDLTMDYYPQEALNNLYLTVLAELGENDEIMSAAENFITTGNSSEVVLEKLKEAYIAKNDGIKGFDEYMSKFSEMAKQMLIDELKNEIINEPAANFTLTDLQGNQVSLSDFKGKNVIVDFWATWCGPCLRSFPGMKIAQEKLESEGNTKFLFVNTWERVDNKLENAKEFIAKNQYPFHVLMDTENEVVAEYKVTGIPTKFIIDKEGNIRFRSIGFRGNTQKIVDEIEVMLDLIK